MTQLWTDDHALYNSLLINVTLCDMGRHKMGCKRGIITLLAAAVLLQIQGSAAQQELPPWTPEKEQAIEDFIAHTLGCRHVVGLSLAVVYDGEVRMTRGYGHEDIEEGREADERSLFCIGSLTKAFTATLWGTIMDESDGE